jgi:hypothetical protein
VGTNREAADIDESIATRKRCCTIVCASFIASNRAGWCTIRITARRDRNGNWFVLTKVDVGTGNRRRGVCFRDCDGYGVAGACVKIGIAAVDGADGVDSY